MQNGTFGSGHLKGQVSPIKAVLSKSAFNLPAEKKAPSGLGSNREVARFHYTRYASYVILQNADPAKEEVASGKTYFAMQTQKQARASGGRLP